MEQSVCFGETIKSLRGEKSIKEIADLAGIDRGHLSRLENSKNRPTEETIKALSKALNADEDKLRISAGYLPTGLDVSVDVILRELSPLKSVQQSAGRVNRNQQSHTALPILGTIRAGIPILTEENYAGHIDVPENIRADFVLEVVGDSMIGAGILEGDYAVCREVPEPQSGQIIVALRNEGSMSEATLKFYFNGNGQPHLRAANPGYPDIDFRDGYRCAGHMVALLRKDAPGYQVYKEYLAVNDSEEWTEVIELAGAAGIKPERMKSFIKMITEVSKGE